MNKSHLVVLASITLIGFFTLVAIVLARGYLPDVSSKSFLPTGILVTTSDPDGARVFINGKLTTATNNTINLAPGSYDISIEKDGFSTWTKKVEIRKEEVIKTNVFLFPKVSDLKPLTLTGAMNPTASLDERKIAYSVASASADKNGVWVIDMDGGRMLIGSFNSRQIYKDSATLKLAGSKLLWSPDGSQILAFAGVKNEKFATNSGNVYKDIDIKSVQLPYLLDSGQLNPLPQLLDVRSLELVLSNWSDLWEEKNTLIFSKLNPKIEPFFQRNVTHLSLSVDETKFLYTATNSASIPVVNNSYLPGSNSTKQDRNLKPGNIYVYDATEDRNYFIMDSKTSKDIVIAWFPSSRHLMVYNDKEIAVMEFDGSNKSTLYTGPFTRGVIVPWPNWSKIVILTSLNSLSGGENLYTLNLR